MTDTPSLIMDKPRPVVLFEVVKGMVTGSPPDIGEERRLSGAEVRSGGPGSGSRSPD